MMAIIFIFSAAAIGYAYLGYPALLWLLGNIYKKPVGKGDFYPLISIVVSAHNEERFLERKILNCLQLAYPADKLEILIGSDGSTDGTNAILDRYDQRGIKAYKLTPNSGKASMLNFLVSKARGELIVFADARQVFDNNVLLELAGNFADEQVGCVTGELVLSGAGGSSFSRGLRAYWDYEIFLRRVESRIYSVIGATGAIYAIRRKLFVPLANNTILDDVYVPLKVIEQGYRAVVEPRAMAYDEPPADRQNEARRKRRTLAGNWQIFIECVKMLNPFRSPVALQLFSHKVLRVLVPYFLISAFVTNAMLLNIPFFRGVFFVQVLFYLFAACGPLSLKMHISILSLPYAFCMLNVDAIVGTYTYFAGLQKVTWDNK
jgi:biofilm PGA synthesis N-glycosyltransferase PgaC